MMYRTLLGIPILLSEYCPNTFTTKKMVGCIGALRFYGVARNPDLRVQVLHEKYVLENQLAYIFQGHVDGGALVEEAFSMITLT